MCFSKRLYLLTYKNIQALQDDKPFYAIMFPVCNKLFFAFRTRIYVTIDTDKFSHSWD